MLAPARDVDASAARLLTRYQALLAVVGAGTPLTKLHTITDGAVASIGHQEEEQL